MTDYQVIITLGGTGKRFSDAGYILPKYLLPVDIHNPNYKVINLVSDMYPGIRKIYLCNEMHIDKYNLNEFLDDGNSVIVSVKPGNGPGDAILQAKHYIDYNLKTFVQYCDTFQPWDINDTIEYINKYNPDSAVVVTNEDCPSVFDGTLYGRVQVFFDELAVIEPCAVAMRAVKNVSDDAETILINGCGFISLVAAQILLSEGKTVYIRNRNKSKLQFALNNFNLIEYNGEKVDCIIDFVSNSSSINYCIDNIISHGKIIAVGNPIDDITINKTNYSKILRKEIFICGIWNSKIEDWYNVMDLIEYNIINVKTLITDSYDFNNFKTAFNEIKENQINHNKNIIKTILTF